MQNFIYTTRRYFFQKKSLQFHQMDSHKPTKYNGFTTKKGNFIWAGALSLAWNQLIDQIVHQPIKIDSKQQETVKIVDNFNHSKFSSKDIDEHSIYVKSGFGQETVNRINTQCKQKFPQKTFADLNVKLSPMDLISYAYLLKKIQFRIPFQKSDNKLFQFEGKNVNSFYAQNQDQKDQIFYSYYKSPDQFMINIYGRNQNDLIYFIKNKEIQDCQQAIKAVEFYQIKAKNHLKQIDHFQMPVVELDVKRQIKELIGKKVLNKSLLGYTFQYICEAIKLNIDQNGAKVQNEAVIGMLGAAFSKNQPQPKYFILNKQFWVVMKQEGKRPYLCALIKDPQDKN